MGDLFYAGGVIFMTPLTVLAVIAIGLAIKKFIDLYINADEPAAKHKPMVSMVLQLGILCFFLGILGQAIGLMDAFKAIEQMGSVSPAMLAGGLFVSMIVSVYGLIILIITIILWSMLKYRMDATGR